MTTATATAIFQIDLAASDNAAPTWVQLMPRGPVAVARDGRRFTFEPSAVISAFAANKGPLPIDYEHGQDHKATKGEIAPAAGWIVELAERDGELWGRVEWTEQAAELIVSKAYRFISPAMRHLGDNRVISLAGAGLVNRPAFVMTALSREDQTSTKENDAMPLKAIAVALGLADAADQPAILAAIAEYDTQRIALCNALDLPETSDLKAAAEKVGEQAGQLRTALASIQTGETALAQQLADTQTALAALQAERKDEKITAALDLATREGKITPAARDDYLALCQQEGGLERFVALAAKLPVIAPPTEFDGDPENLTAGDDEDPIALAAKATTYQKEQAEAGRVIGIDVAVMEVTKK